MTPRELAYARHVYNVYAVRVSQREIFQKVLSEREIQNAVESLRKGRTTVVIAHKLSTIEKADRILVMNAGAIVGDGTHATLIEDNNLYGALYRFHFSEQSEDAPDDRIGSGQDSLLETQSLPNPKE